MKMTKRLTLLVIINLLFIISGFAQSDAERRFAKVVEWAGLNPAMFQTPPDRIRIPCAGGGLAIVQTKSTGIDIFACSGTPITATGSAFTFNGTPFGGGVSGSGTANRVAMWTAATTLGDSPFANNSNSLRIITNNAFLQGTTTGAVVRNLIGIASTDNIHIASGNPKQTRIFGDTGVYVASDSTVEFSVGNTALTIENFTVESALVRSRVNYRLNTNNTFIQGRTTAPATVNLIGVDSSNNISVGASGNPMLFNGNSFRIVTNNIPLKGTTTGASAVDLIGVDNTDTVIVGSSAVNTIVQGGSSSALVKLTTTNTAILGDANGVNNGMQFSVDDSNRIVKMGDVAAQGNGITLNVDDLTNLTVTNANSVQFNNANYQSCTALTTNASGVIGCTVSDKNLKTNIQPFTKGLKALSTIKPQTYTFANGFKKGETQAGFIAQDVAKSIPEAVTKTGAGIEQIDNVTVTAVLVNAVNELSKKVEELQKKVDNLTKENETLKDVKTTKGKTRR